MQGNVENIVPPGSKSVASTRAALRTVTPERGAACGPSPHGLRLERSWLGRTRVVVTRETLEATTPEELLAWTVGLETRHCIPPNESFRLADSIIDAVPLDLTKRAQLLKARVDLRPVNSLWVLSPIARAGEAVSPGEISTVAPAQGAGGLDVEVKQSSLPSGFEIDWYDFVPLAGGRGDRIQLRTAEAHINGKIERLEAPRAPLQFPADARWHQLFMMTRRSESGFDFTVLSARTPVELRDEVTAFERDPGAFKQSADPAAYAALPRGTGINTYLRVRLNGVWTDQELGATVRDAIEKSAPDPHSLLTTLSIRKLHDGKLYRVEWNRSTDRILDLPLEGGEELHW